MGRDNTEADENIKPGMGQLRKYRSNDETTGAEGNSSPDLNVIWTFKRVPVVFFLVMNFVVQYLEMFNSAQ